MDLINECRLYFDFMLPSELLGERRAPYCGSLIVVLVYSAILALGNV